MKIEKTIKSVFDYKKTLEILDKYFIEIGYKKERKRAIDL